VFTPSKYGAPLVQSPRRSPPHLNANAQNIAPKLPTGRCKRARQPAWARFCRAHHRKKRLAPKRAGEREPARSV